MVTHFRIRLYLIAALVMGGFGVLIFRLYQVQVTESEYYTKRVPVKKLVSVRIPGTRGEIKDRNGITLVDSTPNYELRFDLREVVDAYRKRHPKEKLPPYTWERYDQFGQKEIKTEIDIVKIVEDVVWPGLKELGLLADYSASSLRVHYRSTKGLVPFTFRRDLSFKEFARFAENNLGIPGVEVTRTGRRRYLYDSLGVHFLGYMNLADNDHVPEGKKKEFNYYVGDDYGVMGVEKTMDSYLQGKAGTLLIEKDEKGKFVREVSKSEAKPGPDVFLTIDAKLQLVAEESLRKVGRGAAVVIDPRNGDILAMASVPSYNPNVFIPEVNMADWKRITGDKTDPLINRAVNAYSPGSTCKIPIALSGCLSDSWRHRFPCGGGKQYGSKFMKCWSSHGTLDLSSAIKHSCNGFFYRYANDTGIRNIQTMTGLLGLGRVTGIRITGEKPGNIPNPEWLRAQGHLWSDAFTALVAIGQGATECTPLQMASVTASVASGGKVYQPRIIKKVQEKNGKIVLEEPPKLRHDLTREGITAQQVEIVKHGMWRVVNESGGTAGRARSKLTVISGKTGTTQTGNPRQPTNAWFISFAPYDDPEVAVCVFVENGISGGGAASPIVKNIIENYTAMKEGKKVELVALPAAVGNTDRVTGVSFHADSQSLMAFIAQQSESEESAVDVAAFLPQSMRKRTFTPIFRNFIQPTIKKQVDSRGRVGSLNSRSTPKFQPFKNLFKKRKQSRFSR